MKIRDYEKRGFLYFLISCLLGGIIVFGSSLFFNKHYTYIKYNSVVMTDDLVLIMIDNRQMKYLYQNKFLYVDGSKKKFSIKEIHKNILKKKNNNYNEVLIEFDLAFDKYLENDVIEITLKKEKERNINLFKIIWKE